MPWVRLDADITEHPKVAAVGGFGLALQAAGLAYSNRNLTDGFVPRAIVPGLLSWELIDADGKVWTGSRSCGMVGDDITNRWIAEELAAAGVWHDEGGAAECERCAPLWPATRIGYLIHDYPEYQPTKAEVEALREVRAKAGKRGGKAKAKRLAKAKQIASNGSGKAEAKTYPVPGPVPVTEPVPQTQEQEKLPSPEAIALCELLADLIEANGSKRPRITKHWREEADRMLRLDSRDPGEAEDVLRWCQADGFWRGNILSMPKFRDKYDTLRLKASAPPARRQVHQHGMNTLLEAEAERRKEGNDGALGGAELRGSLGSNVG